MLTAASVHDSQVAIPLATITAGRVTNLYDLMDSAYDVAAIKQHSRDLNHVLIIDINPRATPGLKQELAEEAEAATPCRASHSGTSSVTANGSAAVERVNGGLKDNHGGRTVRVRVADRQSDVPPDVRSSGVSRSSNWVRLCYVTVHNTGCASARFAGMPAGENATGLPEMRESSSRAVRCGGNQTRSPNFYLEL